MKGLASGTFPKKTRTPIAIIRRASVAPRLSAAPQKYLSAPPSSVNPWQWSEGHELSRGAPSEDNHGNSMPDVGTALLDG